MQLMTAFGVHGYTIIWRNRNAFGGGVAAYVKSHIPDKIRYDLMSDDTVVLWIQVNLPNLKPLLTGCCYSPPNA